MNALQPEGLSADVIMANDSTRWSGVSLQQLLPDLGLQPNATHLKIHSADGFFEVVALDAIRLLRQRGSRDAYQP